MLLQDICFTGRELNFRATIQFITLREEHIVEEINGKRKKCKIKDSLLKIIKLKIITSNSYFRIL